MTQSNPEKPFRVLLFYKFVSISDPERVRNEHYAFCKSIGLKGRTLIATEGINGTVSGTVEQTNAFIEGMNQHALFYGIEYKIDEVEQNAFHKLHVRVKPELVHMGVENAPRRWELTAEYIEPEKMKEILRQDDPDIVYLDMRSKFEWDVGRFKDAIVLETEHFRDIPSRLQELEHIKDKKIISYCTGGIRCEKITGMMIEHGFKNLYQLHGGIVRYGHEQGGENFEGACYVFDNRVVAPVNSVNPTVVGHCEICQGPSEFFVNCANAECNKHFIICHSCAEEKEGCCSDECHAQPKRRKWDGTGQYHRGINSKNYIIV